MSKEHLRKLIEAAELNQTSAAARLGVHRQTVIRWLKGTVPISERSALLINLKLKPTKSKK